MTWMLLALLVTDLAAVKQEPNLEHRSELAITYANTALDAARDAYQAGDMEKTQAALSDVGDSVDLAWESLQATGKSPRKSPKFFKRAELGTRELLRRIEGFSQVMSARDREMTLAVRDRVADVHDELLKGIMAKKP